MDKITSLLQQSSIFCLNSASDDDLYKIYYIESRNLRNKWYRVIATAFGATSCSCDNQTENPYQSCNHMKRLDKMLEDFDHPIQNVKQLP